MSCNNHMKKNCKCNKKSNLELGVEKCNVDLGFYPNTYTPGDAIQNLEVLDKVYLSMKSAVIHYVTNISGLYMNLAQAQSPNKLTLVQNLERFKLLQEGLLNEIKTISESKFTDMTDAIPTVVSHISIDNFSKKNGDTPELYFKDIKKLISKRLFVKFDDGTSIEFLSVPSFLLNVDKFNDSLTLKISEPSNNLLSSNAFYRGPEKESFLFINSDTNDGYLYKDINGEYHPDRSDAYNHDENIKTSVASVLEFYESIINVGTHQDIGHPEGNTFISGSDIQLLLNTLDLQIKKNQLAKRMICLRTVTN